VALTCKTFGGIDVVSNTGSASDLKPLSGKAFRRSGRPLATYVMEI
jgi:hypothetical protein